MNNISGLLVVNKEITTIDNLIRTIARLPGLGPRSARRLVLYLLRKQEEVLKPLLDNLQLVYTNIKNCSICGNIDLSSPCSLCQDPQRATNILIVVETVADLWAIERSQTIQARYHVLGGSLSAIDGIMPKDLRVSQLLERVSVEKISEIILAMNATIEGQSTIHYLAELLNPFHIPITRLAHGLPIGGELDYLDENTLTTSIQKRISL